MPTTIEHRVSHHDVINVWPSMPGEAKSMVGIGFGPLLHYMPARKARELAYALIDAADAATAPLPVADVYEVS